MIGRLAKHLKNFVVEKEDMEDIVDETDAILDKDINARRAQNNRLYKLCLTISESQIFEFFIAVCIVANTILLGLDSYPSDSRKDRTIDDINACFYLVFLNEMLIKWLGFGFAMYFK